MEEKLKELEVEIEVLKQRVNSLEKIETRRKIKTIIKTVVSLILLLIISFSIYNFYQKIVEIYESLPVFF